MKKKEDEESVRVKNGSKGRTEGMSRECGTERKETSGEGETIHPLQPGPGKSSHKRQMPDAMEMAGQDQHGTCIWIWIGVRFRYRGLNFGFMCWLWVLVNG